jgi:hypothetical protein
MILFPNIIKKIKLSYYDQNFVDNKKDPKNLKKLYEWAIKNQFFDYNFYKKKYLLDSDSFHSFEFYIKTGFLLNHNPSKKFSTIIYYSLRPDVQFNNINPLLHYYNFGQKEDPILIDKFTKLSIDEDGFETPKKENQLILSKFGNHKNVPKIFAFYLPGFHEDKFNNKSWGKGFTE